MRSFVLLTMLALSFVAFGPLPSAQAAPECSAKTVEVATAVGDFGVATASDCTADVWAFRGVICVGGWGGQVERQIGPANVEVSYCTPPRFVDPASAPGCKAVTVSQVSIDETCHVTIDLDLVDCLWNEKRIEKTYGPVTVIFTYCTGSGGGGPY